MPAILTAPAVVLTYPDFGSFLTYGESIKSATAIRLGIVNTPTPQQYDNLRRTYLGLFLPVCREFGRLPVTSMFRSKRLNTAVKGSKNSSHMDGLAIDIDCDGYDTVSNKELYKWCMKNKNVLKMDQAITEFPDAQGNPSWIHLSYRLVGYQRQQGMRAVKKDGQVYYMYE